MNFLLWARLGLLLFTGCSIGGGTIYTPPDILPPIIVTTTPENNDMGVAITAPIRVTFSERMRLKSINTKSFVVMSSSGVPVSGTVNLSINVATFIPSANLEPSPMIYTATITTDAEDVVGNSVIRNFSWSFATIAASDSTAPMVLSVNPDNDAENIAVNAILIATFSEEIDPATINNATFLLSKGGRPVIGAVGISGVAATFTPGENLDSVTSYTATITTGVKDNAGNGLVLDFSWGFTTKAPPPPPPIDAPDPPVLSLGFSLKQLQFSWADVSGETFYKLMENHGGVGFMQVGADIPADRFSLNLEIAVHKHNWANTSYRLSACNSASCADSNEVSTSQGVLKAIGYLKASNTGVNDNFGASVALSRDGQTVAVGAGGESSSAIGTNGVESDNTATSSGAVYLFSKNGLIWSQQAYIKGSNTGVGDIFGASVALSDDGNTLAVGAEGESSSAVGMNGNQADNTAFEAGAVYLFTRAAGGWSQQAYIKASNTGASDQFGASVSLSGDGNTLAVGAGGESSSFGGIGGIGGIGGDATAQADDSFPEAGAVYLFTRSGFGWNQQAYIKPKNPAASDFFGDIVSLNRDGNTLAVGAVGESSSATGMNGDGTNNDAVGSGATYIFTRAGNLWSQQAYLKASNNDPIVSGAFGGAVSMSADGNTVAVGAEGESSVAFGAGAVYLFTRVGTIWSEQAMLHASNPGVIDSFGGSVSLSADGNAVAVGTFVEPAAGGNGEDSNATGVNGNQANNLAPNSGAVYFFTRSGAVWGQTAYLKASNTGANDAFGLFVSLNEDGNTLAVGAPLEDSSAQGINGNQINNTAVNAGALYLY